MKKAFYKKFFSILYIGSVVFSIASCADDELVNNNKQGGNSGTIVRFNVNSVQDEAIARASATGLIKTGSIVNGLTQHDLAPQKLQAYSNAGLDVSLIETTVEGINPTAPSAKTRANIETEITKDFTTFGYRGTTISNISATPDWFYARKTKSDGTLYQPLEWMWEQRYARFFAVSPEKDSYTKMTLSPSTHSGTPYVDFEVEEDVEKQVDFMTSTTGEVVYETRGVAPTTNLDFRHALTAVQFAVGQNLSWDKTISRVEISNVIMKGRYNLPNKFNGEGASWDLSNSGKRGTAVLSDINVSTSASPNSVIMGRNGDNYTFYMIPQTLTGNNVRAKFYFTDNTIIDVPLTGDWKAGTTRTFKLSQRKSSWEYVLTTTSPVGAYYTQDRTNNYTVTSYRNDPSTGEKQAVAWKVIGYSEDDGKTWTTKLPTWISQLTSTSGNGGTAANSGFAFLRVNKSELLTQRQNALKNATALGSASVPYDLSTRGGTTTRNTANCYIISAPGHYRIPLVYGNAIKDGIINENSYKSTAKGQYVLEVFKDHADQDITNPWIEKTNNGANAGIDGAKIVWQDEANLVSLGSTPIVHSGDEAYLEFEVSKDNIKSGNAVVAVTKKGTTVWSWHLWFAPQEVLTPIEIVYDKNIKYGFTTETLGWKYTEWEGSTFSQPRIAKIRVEQQLGNNGVKQISDITIQQNPGFHLKGYAPLYQGGRKDPSPGTTTLYNSSFEIDKTQGDRTIGYGIQHPEKLLGPTNIDNTLYKLNWFSAVYDNLWSANNIDRSINDNEVVKTIYDPSPVGFKLPPSNAFRGITRDRAIWLVAKNPYGYIYKETYGYIFWTDDSHTQQIGFPAVGLRSLTGNNGDLINLGSNTGYWSAIPTDDNNSFFGFGFKDESVNSATRGFKSNSWGVRPIAE